MSESTDDHRMTPGLEPVAFVDLTVPRATEGSKSIKEGKAMEDKGKSNAEEGQDTYGEGGSSGRGGGRGESTCRHGKQRGKCRECPGEDEAAGEEERGREEPETQWREKRARTTQPSTKCPHNRQRSKCKECGGASICQHLRIRSQCKECGGSSICPHQRERSKCKECGGASICPHQRIRSKCKDCREEADESMPAGLEELEGVPSKVARSAGEGGSGAVAAAAGAAGKRVPIVMETEPVSGCTGPATVGGRVKRKPNIIDTGASAASASGP